jgi:uncharacterized membrane protein YoaT (DUF817 family)
MAKSKLFSLIVAAFYLIYFSVTTLINNPKNIVTVVSMLLIWLLPPLALIWYAEQIGLFLGRSRYQYLKPNWAVLVQFAGWVLLLLPVFMFIFEKLNIKP